ncbi:MAG TPA: hypothetical protein VEY89_06940 [Candidatus Dormibacteraeota bacterium]|nr:hypothetical protein [Candidatus Dormibacteraeota bacterium]
MRSDRTGAALVASGLALLALAGSSAPATAADKKPLQLAPGAHVGVLNLLDPEVTQFHASRRVQDSFLKTYSVNWPMSGVLMEALRDRLTGLGLAPVAVTATEALRHARETCFLTASLVKSLPKGCGPLYAQLADAEHVDALIVLGPGLNDSNHAGGTRRRELPEYLRGWCFVSEEGPFAPALLNLTELLLIGLKGGAGELAAREWGGADRQSWSSYRPPADPKEPPEAQLAELQPLFAAMLKTQAGSLIGQLQVTR